MNINKMTKKEFLSLPWREEFENEDGNIECCSLVILPTNKKHDSGYRAMDFVAVNENEEPICRLSGCSDVIHIEGIGGLGFDWFNRYKTCPKLTPPIAWSIDCLPKSGLLRIFSTNREKIICTSSLSSFEIYSKYNDNDDLLSNGDRNFVLTVGNR